MFSGMTLNYFLSVHCFNFVPVLTGIVWYHYYYYYYYFIT